MRLSPLGSSRAWLATVGLVLLALALRVWALDFGLPLAEARPDELTIAFQAMKFGRGDLNPHSFNYPSLFKYCMFGLFGVYALSGPAVWLWRRATRSASSARPGSR